MRPYVVIQGEYLAKLANRHHFDAQAIWAHPKNEALRKKRPDPETLCPGDILYIPDTPPRPQPLTRGAMNVYRARIPTVPVELVLRDADGPLAFEPFEVAELARSDRTDVNGLLTVQVPVTRRSIVVAVPRLEWSRMVLVGDLDPIEEPSGVRMRLEHLGYVVAAEEDHAPALSRFQRDHGLPVTGVLDDATRDALHLAHRGEVQPTKR